MADPGQLRVIVGLDMTSTADAAVEAAIMLARSFESEVSGLFVEDEALAHAVALPFTLLVRQSGTLSPIDPARLERTLGAAASEARRALTIAAEQARLPWSFRTARGSLLAELLAAAAERDLIVLGGGRAPAIRGGRPGRVVAVFDRAAMTTPLLDVAAAVAAARGERLVVLVPEDGDPEPMRRAADWAERTRAIVRIVDAVAVPGIVKALRREQATLLLSSARSEWLRESSLTELRQQLECPLALVK